MTTSEVDYKEFCRGKWTEAALKDEDWFLKHKPELMVLLKIYKDKRYEPDEVRADKDWAESMQNFEKLWDKDSPQSKDPGIRYSIHKYIFRAVEWLAEHSGPECNAMLPLIMAASEIRYYHYAKLYLERDDQ